MKNISETMWDVWESGNFTGDNRPIVRAAISKRILKPGELSYGAGGAHTIMFQQTAAWHEVPNIETCRIDRRLGTDAGQMTMTINNQIPIDASVNLDLTHADATGIGMGGTGSTTPTRRQLGDLGYPGFYTFRRGALDREGESPWGHEPDTTWVDMFIPNRMIATFQGYGTDDNPNPWSDSKLVLTGIWLIDTVEYTSGGKINIACRDNAKLLIEQRVYPPVVPLEHYPLEFCYDQTAVESEEYELPTTVTEVAESYGANVAKHLTSGWDSSAAPWYGYNATVYGHRASHAFDGDPSTYWLSVGNSGPNQPWSFEWIQANTSGEPVNQIYFKPKWGGYVVYVSVKVGGVWQGTEVVPYGYTSTPAYPNDSNIKYVKKITIPSGETYQTITLDETYNADAVRLCFTNLQNSGLGTYPYRAAVYDFQVRLYTPASTETVGGGTGTREVSRTIPGNITDYTDIVKVLCAWAGFWWPYGDSDPILQKWDIPEGRVWGDFFYSGAWPEDPPCIDKTYWDNKSVMDAINQVKEILGFIFYIDSSGGVVWRPPNIWQTGNYITGVGYVGEDSVRTVHEDTVLLDLGVTINDTNLRSEIIAVSAKDPTLSGAYTPNWSDAGDPSTSVTDLSLLAGQRRVMLVPNYPFQNQDEVNKFALLVSLWIHWSYRTSSFRIPGNPAYEPDDQIRIHERVSSELFVHYIQGVNSYMDVNKGTWYMDVDTHWLGNGPADEWVVNVLDLIDSPGLIAYLRAIPGGLTDEAIDSIPPEFVWEPPDLTAVDWRPEPDTDMFPDPPDLVWPDAGWSSEGDTPSYIDDPVGGSGGSAFNCSNGAKFDYWGAGPFSRTVSSPWQCNTSNLTTLTFLYKWSEEGPQQEGVNTHRNQGATVSVKIDRRAAQAYRMLAKVIAEAEYNVFSLYGYDCRPVVKIVGGVRTYSTTSWSNHAWGLAVDINASVLPYGSRTSNSTVIAFGNRAVDKIRCGNGQKVFRWGQDWNTPDPMHFEVCCTPSDLATGVVLNP